MEGREWVDLHYNVYVKDIDDNQRARSIVLQKKYRKGPAAVLKELALLDPLFSVDLVRLTK